MTPCKHLSRIANRINWNLPALQSSRRWKTTESHPQYCMGITRKFDYDHFLCTLLMPKTAQSAVFALRAFNVEISQIREIVSNKNIGLMRMQFWKDSITQMYEQENPPHTPVAFELYKAIKKHQLTRRWLMRLISAREQQLQENDRAFHNIKEVEDYAENTVSSLHYLTLECLGVRDVNADHVASHIGKSQGIVTLLRSVPFHGNKSRVYLPVDLLLKHNVSQTEIIRGRREQKVKDLVFDIASTAKQHLDKARSLSKDVPKTARPAFIPTVPCEAFLTTLQKADFDIFDSNLHQKNNWLPLQLYLQKLKRTY